MELQRILFPQAGKCVENELYFRTERNLKLTTEEIQAIQLEKGERISFDTYFNSFSMEKWNKYTIVDNICLKLKLSGKMQVRLIGKEIQAGKLKETVINEKIFETDTPDIFEIGYDGGNGKGIYTFEIKGLSDRCVFYGGVYCLRHSVERIRNIKIGICICTYKREEFIEKNLRILNREILNNEASPLYGHLEVFVADNGRTLDINKLQSDKIHIFQNRNLGGAGGFTRDLVEIYENNSKFEISHALLMDDDVVIEPDAIVRTYRILSLLKEEYTDAFIGGAMLRLDKPYMQAESGAQWNMGKINVLKGGLDMRLCENCVMNEQEESAEYNGWWFCCYPMSVVRDDNLPLPLFIRFDDIEYDLRNMSERISMNGICVWHEPFDNKNAPYLEYYIARNLLIVNAIHYRREYGVRKLFRFMLGRCAHEIRYNRYTQEKMFLMGIRDFMRGYKWLESLDGEKYHRKVMDAAKAQPVHGTAAKLAASVKYIFTTSVIMLLALCKYKGVQRGYSTEGICLMTLESWKERL